MGGESRNNKGKMKFDSWHESTEKISRKQPHKLEIEGQQII